jgi:hypothetical protein
MTARLLDLDAFRESRLSRLTAPLACVHAEARPGLLLIHVPRSWEYVELTTKQARIWLEQLAQLVETAEELDGGSRG